MTSGIAETDLRREGTPFFPVPLWHHDFVEMVFKHGYGLVGVVPAEGALGSTSRSASAANARRGAKGIEHPLTIGHRALVASDAQRQIPQGRLTVTDRRLPNRPYPVRQAPVGRRRRAGRWRA